MRIRFMASVISIGLAVTLIAAPAQALDTPYQSQLRDAKPLSIGQEVPIAGYVLNVKSKKNPKKRAQTLTPLNLRVSDFGISSTNKDCRGTPESPTYCDDFVGGYVPTYRVAVDLQNRTKFNSDYVTAELLCSNSTQVGSNQQSITATPLLPRSGATVDLELYLPRDVNSPAECVEPVVLFKSLMQVSGKLEGKKYPFGYYLPVTL